jgi:hypothetical protein
MKKLGDKGSAWMVNVRGEGWKEFKTGTVYDVEHHCGATPKTRELVQVPIGVHIGYRLHGGARQPTGFCPGHVALAVAHDLPDANESSVTSDGIERI